MSMLTPILAFVLPCLPLAAAALLFVPRTSVAILRLAPWLPLTALGLLPLNGQVVEFPWLLLGARVGLEGPGAWLLAPSILVWTLAGAQAAGSLAGQTAVPEERKAFFCFWLLTWTGNLCVLITMDAASFYAAYAMMTFSAYGLIVQHRRLRDVRAGRVYMVFAVAGEGMLVAALLILGASAGNVALEHAGARVADLPNTNLVAFLLAAGFGVKMGIFPLHAWLPIAHPQAPVPASAVLSGVIVKAGLLGWLRFLPLETGGGEPAGTALLVAGLFTAFYGVAAGIPQSRPKIVLAYSTVSQMGLIAVAVGVAVLNPTHAGALIAAATLLALHHGLSKGALFLSAGLRADAPNWIRKLVWIPALAIAGAPLTSGALAKVALKLELPPDAGVWLTSSLLASSALTTLLMARFLYVFENGRRGEGSAPCWPFASLVGMSLVAAWLAAWAWHPAWLSKTFEAPYLLQTGGPIAGAGLIALFAARRWRGLRWPHVPAGDLLALLPDWRGRPSPSPVKRIRKRADASHVLVRAEIGLAQFYVAFLCGVGLVGLAFALGWLASKL